MMQDIDPTKRPGAGPDGYISLKSHPFFKGIDWTNLRVINPPQLALDPRVRSSYFISVFINVISLNSRFQLETFKT